MSRTDAAAWEKIEVRSPAVSGPLAVYPVPEEDGPRGEPDDYLLLQDALEMDLARVTEVNEGGRVPELLFANLGNLPVLAVQGEELRGAKQNRALNVSFLGGPGKTAIPVTCVEMGRWAYRDADEPLPGWPGPWGRRGSRRAGDEGRRGFGVGQFEHADLRRITCYQVMRSVAAAELHEPARATDRYGAEQKAVWNEVARESSRHGVRSPTLALSAVFDDGEVRKSRDDLERGIRLPKDTRGAVVAIGGRLVAAELFESAAVFRRMWPRLQRSYALGARHRKEDTDPPEVEKAAAFANRPGVLEPKVNPSVGLGEDLRWEDKEIVAAALRWRGRLLHGVVFG